MSVRPARRLLLAVACVTAFGGCALDPDPADPGSAAVALIAQQPDFFFLPPIVPPPARFGDFLPDLAPTVVAEQLDPGDGVTVLRTLATYTRAGAAALRVRVHVQNGLPDDGDADPAGYFVLRFRSGDFALAGGDRVRFRVLLDGHQLGLANVAVLDRRRDKRLIDRSQYGFVVAGDVLRVKFRFDRGAVGGGGDPCADVVCTASRSDCLAGTCSPATGACSAERCIEDAPATFSGTVRGRDVGPLAGASVALFGAGGAHVAAITAADGTFSVQVPFAAAELHLDAPRFATQVEPLTFAPDTLAEGYEYLLVPNVAWYDVTVWGGVGSPLPGATVRISYDGGGSESGVTDQQGHVLFDFQPIGVPFTLHASSGGFVVDQQQPALQAGSNTILVGLY